MLVLGGGTLLAGQVQSDLEAGVQDATGEMDLGSPRDAPALKLNEFRLPKDTPLEIPEGALVSPDLSEVTLPRDVDLQLPGDLDLSNLDFELPSDFDLELPAGSVAGPTGLDLPQGGSLRLPDGRTFSFPPGSHLDIPPALADRLRQQGISGALPFDRLANIRGLPEGTSAQLDPPQFTGPGSLRLPAGSTIRLPDGQTFPFAAGALAAAAQHLLPAGTSFDVPFDENGAGGTFPVPQPRSTSQLQPRTPGSTQASRIAVETEITQMPSRVRKGESFVVGGYVRERATRAPVAGAPVDVFLNETKRAPGQLVGQGASDAAGRFRIALDIPHDKPAANYQLVNHASAFRGADGRLYADGWGDPPLATYASTMLTMSVPARDGFGARTPVNGTLVDHTGAPVAGVPIAISVDGAPATTAVTSAAGAFLATYVFPAGAHRVEARFAGTSNYEPSNTVAANITITEYTLDVPATLRTTPGGTLTLSGRLTSQGAALPERYVNVSGLPWGASGPNLLTDATGRFATTLAVPLDAAPGSTAIRYQVASLAIDKPQVIEVNLTGTLSLAAPSSWDAEVPFFANVELTTAEGGVRPLAGQAVRLTLTGPGGTSATSLQTDSLGIGTATLSPLRPAPGVYTLTARVVGPPNLLVPAATARVVMGVLEVEWDVPAEVVRGEDATLAGTVRFADRPLASTGFTLDGLAPTPVVTDAQGRFTWTGRVDPSTPVGARTLTLSTIDHPARSTEVTLLAATRIELEAPGSFVAGEPVELSLAVRDDTGAPVRDALVTLTAVAGSEVGRHVVRTDADGRWQGPVNLTREANPNVTLSARFDASRPYMASDATKAMAATAPIAPPARSPLLWVVPLALVGAAGLGAGAWWLARTRAGRAREVPVVAATPAAAPVLRAPDFDVRLGIPPDEPVVWGVGEPLEVTVEDRGEGGEVELRWSGGTKRVRVERGGVARVALAFDQEGEVALSAQRVGVEDVAAASATLRVVDYRKETAREFDLFLDKARNLDAKLDRRSTPREIQWALAAYLGGEAEARLDDMALVMEITNYSHHDVSRAHYLRFVRASRALDPFFAPRMRAPDAASGRAPRGS